MELERYEQAINELSTKNWMQKNPTIKAQIDTMLTQIITTKHNITNLNLFTQTLLSYLFEPLDPPQLFRPKQSSIFRGIEVIDDEQETEQTYS